MDSCRLCGSQADFIPLDIEIENGTNYLVLCSKCHGVLAQKKTPANQVKEIYDELFAKGGYIHHKKQFEMMMSGGSPYFPYRKLLFNHVSKKLKGNFVVEIGGGAGAFGHFVNQKGYQYQDFDVSNTAMGFVEALGLHGQVFDPEDLSTLNFDSTDLVAMWEVIEHVWDVAGYLRKIYNNLAQEGFLLLSTPNINRRYYMTNLEKPSTSSPPIHINFFSKESLEYGLRAAGFRNIRFFHKRFERPQMSLSGIYWFIKFLLGVEPEKNLYCLAQK